MKEALSSILNQIITFLILLFGNLTPFDVWVDQVELSGPRRLAPASRGLARRTQSTRISKQHILLLHDKAVRRNGYSGPARYIGENKAALEQGRIHGISRSPSLFLPADKVVMDQPTDRRTNGRTHPLIESWLTAKKALMSLGFLL